MIEFLDPKWKVTALSNRVAPGCAYSCIVIKGLITHILIGLVLTVKYLWDFKRGQDTSGRITLHFLGHFSCYSRLSLSKSHLDLERLHKFHMCKHKMVWGYSEGVWACVGWRNILHFSSVKVIPVHPACSCSVICLINKLLKENDVFAVYIQVPIAVDRHCQ